MALPFTIPERAVIKISRVSNSYYMYVHARYSTKFMLWKINADGSATDLSDAFKKLLRLVPFNTEPEFELIPNNQGFFFTYHTDFGNTEKNTLVLLQTDSLLNSIFLHKLQYDFKRDEEALRQETIMFGKYLLVLKTTRSNTALEVMKINLATGFSIKNSFYSAGHLYSQPVAYYNAIDSGITVAALLTDMSAYAAKSYVFSSRLNKILIEQGPPVVLKNQFAKNTSTNFLLAGEGRWVRLRAGYQQARGYSGNSLPVYQNYVYNDSSMLPGAANPVTVTAEKYANWPDQEPGVRFSLLDKDFKIINERYVANTRDAYSIMPDKFAKFRSGSKEYMLVGQRFSFNRNGLLMVNADAEKLVYTNVGVNFRNEYLLSKCQSVGQNKIIMPYIHRRYAGLLQLTIPE
jgi:hypothetical protein